MLGTHRFETLVFYLGLPELRGKLRVRYALGLLKYQMIKPFSS